MITCPFCQKEVQDIDDNPVFEDEDGDDVEYWCPTIIKVYEGTFGVDNQPHFYKVRFGVTYIPGHYREFHVVKPPFHLKWTDTTNEILVLQMGKEWTQSVSHQYFKGDYNYFLKLCQRYEKLKAFA